MRDNTLLQPARSKPFDVYPLRLDDAVLTTTQGWAQALRDGRHIGDFRQWTEYAAYHAVFARLLRDLKAEQP